MLDRYVWGTADRVSPEAPVLVVKAGRQDVRLGGAAAVAYLLAGLDVHAEIAGVIGQDSEGQTLIALLREVGIDYLGIIQDKERPTTCKTRYLGQTSSRHPHQILRVDQESTAGIGMVTELALRDAILEKLTRAQGVLIADYGKGAVTERLLEEVIAASRIRQIPVFVDPARGAHWNRYRNATLIKPNRTEAECVLGRPLAHLGDALDGAVYLRETYEIGAVAITLDREGIVVASSGQATHVPAEARFVNDVTGAGDMALAILAICASSGISFVEAASLANLAAGMEVESFGVTAISWRDLRGEARLTLFSATEDACHAGIACSIEDSCHLGACVLFANRKSVQSQTGWFTCIPADATWEACLFGTSNGGSPGYETRSEVSLVPSSQQIATHTGSSFVESTAILKDNHRNPLLQVLSPKILVNGQQNCDDRIVGQALAAFCGAIFRMDPQAGETSGSKYLATLACQDAFKVQVWNEHPNVPDTFEPDLERVLLLRI